MYIMVYHFQLSLFLEISGQLLAQFLSLFHSEEPTTTTNWSIVMEVYQFKPPITNLTIGDQQRYLWPVLAYFKPILAILAHFCSIFYSEDFENYIYLSFTYL